MVVKGRPDLRVQIRHGFIVEQSRGLPEKTMQIVRDGQPVVTRPLVKIQRNLAASVIPYSEDFDLTELLPGKYLLQVTAINRVAKKTATRSARFTIQSP